MVENISDIPVIANRYRLLDKIGQGGMGVVYRALDRLDGSIVALKRVTTPGERLQFASKGDSTNFRLALAQEFRVLASLRHPNIISVLDYGFDAERQPFFTMELLENAQTIRAYANGKSVSQQINFLIQVLQALAYLHRRGILHRDLKPDNLLVVDGQVKVLDFGLAVAREAIHEDGQTAGTVAYMAPEILQGSSATEPADLYAVGVIAYELFSGHHPFQSKSFSHLINDILNTTPDIEPLEIDDSLKLILEKLLAKSPSERYASADEILSIFAQSIGQPISAEAAAIRESYLQAAAFVGREAELQRLTAVLDTMTAGTGSAWLVGGESGVGKSRLLDELRTRALVNGALVLRGQAIVEGGAPYQLWRESLRRLCLQTNLTDLEASVLKSLIPDIGSLINQVVPDAPELDAQAAQLRLLSVIEDVFRKQSQPILLLLEDLQWAEESLSVLKRLTQAVHELPLLIVANYRDDERPNLPAELPDMQPIKLARLDENAIADLSASMLGESGRQPHVIDLLQRETEGNVFFIVEVVRALAEEAGQLAQIGQMTLPLSVFAGGIQTVVQRRLSRVPTAARPLLQIAAVAGRELDLTVLKAAAPVTNIDDWLTSVATVIDVQDNRYRFAHDKLREGLVQNLPDENRKILHKTVAEAVAIAYPDNPTQYTILHFHWEQVGDLDNARHYAELGGEAALKDSAAAEAIRLLNRALELQPAHVDNLHLGHLHRLLGQAQMALGYTVEAERTLQQAGVELGYPLLIHAPAWRLALDIVVQFARQVPQFAGWKPKKLEGQKQEILREAMIISWPFDRISQNLSYGPLDLFSMRLRYANWAAQAEPSLDQLNADSIMAILFLFISIQPLTRFYLKRAQHTADVLGGPRSEFYIIRVHSYNCLRVGGWEAGLRYAKLAIPFTQQIGDKRVEAESVTVVISYACFAGHFDQASETILELESLAASTRDEGFLGWALIYRATMSHWCDDENAFANAVSRLGQIDAPDDGIRHNSHLGLKSVFLWRVGRLSEASASIHEAVAAYEGLSAPIFPLYHGLNELTRACAMMAEHPEYAEVMRACLARMVAVAHRMQRLYRLTEPGYQLYRGLAAFLANNPRRAQQFWQKSLTAARKWRMPYDEGRALYEIGRHLPEDDPKRAENLKSAAAIFERIGATWDLRLTREALEKPAI
jgi:eukaryotic-like serine/threonine-protein kinase